MDYGVFTTDNFEKDFKKLLKKYPTLKETFLKLTYNLKSGNFHTAKAIQGFSHNVYKIRLGDKQKGKRSGYRVIYFKLDQKKRIYLLSIYSKSDKKDVTNPEITSILKRIKI